MKVGKETKSYQFVGTCARPCSSFSGPPPATVQSGLPAAALLLEVVGELDRC